MTLVKKIESVWVPFEVFHPADGGQDGTGNICSDIPRFLSPEECKDFIQLNSIRLSRRLIQFREYTDEVYKQEYAKGVGREANRGWRYGPLRS